MSEPSGHNAWSANTRNWAMSSYTELPVSHIGNKFAVGPGGIYIRGEDPLEVEARIETGDLNLINGANYNVNRLYLTLRETSGVDVVARANYYSGSDESLYFIEHLEAEAVSGEVPVTYFEKERNVGLGRGPDGNTWAFVIKTHEDEESGAVSGSWRITNFDLQINRARKAKR